MPLTPLLGPIAIPSFSTTNDLLGMLLIGGNCLGYEQISVTQTETVELTVPAQTKYALLVVEADTSTTDKTRCIRFLESDLSPTPTDGMPLGDLGIYEVKGTANLSNFKAIGIEAGKTHTLNIQYYG